MGIEKSRRIRAGVLMGAGAVMSAGTFGSTFLGNTERVVDATIVATLSESGPASISETYDYEFGPNRNKHGIYRTIPAPAPTDVLATSETAAADLNITEGAPAFKGGVGPTNIRVGDPDKLVMGRHRYQLRYQYDRSALVRDVEVDGVTKPTLSWNAVGSEWPVGFDHVRAEVVSDRFLTNPICNTGFGSSPCVIVADEPGRLVVEADSLKSGSALTITATVEGPVDRPTAQLSAPAPRGGPGLIIPTAATGLGAVLLGGAVAWLLRRIGRERVSAGGAADAAFASGVGERRVDAKELASMSTIEFTPPKDLTPAQGGVVLAESVTNDHLAAWLMSEVVAGSVTMDGPPSSPMLKRAGLASPQADPVLDSMFNGRDSVTLGTYDPAFATAWSTLTDQLRQWREDSRGWDRRGDKRRLVAMWVGNLALLAGLAVVTVGVGLVARRTDSTIAVLLTALGGAVLGGGGLSAAMNASELRMRTAVGSSQWLRVESFRRFFAESETQHVEQAARLGSLREYTAWAVALGEVDRWNRVMSASGVKLDQATNNYLMYAPMFARTTNSAAAKPSSSSSSGGSFGGGSAGSGGGGGGGGSW
jgi:uncharacterized membrane protein YgcG